MESKRSFNLVTVSMSENCLHVGDRIEDASTNSRGTIRYIGPVATSNDDTMVYYGVEWDEWGRGLNDGSVTLPNGEKKYYFQGLLSRSSKTKTLEFKFSFVKKNKMISEKMCQRTTLIEMLQERYAHENENEKDSLHHLKDIVIAGEVGTAFGKEKPIELVGVKKLRTQQKLETIEKISLSNCKIASIGNFVPGTLGKMTPNITELNLSFNLFTKWSDIFQLIHELPLLESLILSGNRLIYDIQEKELEKKLFTKIQVLVLNNTSISWKQIKEIVKCHFSSLKELYVAENEIKDDDLVLPLSFCSSSLSELPETLETLDLSHNLLQDWQTICKAFGSLTNLKQLVLNGNQIQTIVTKNASSTTSAIPIVSSVSSVPFSNLESISLTDNLVDSWTSIDELNKYKKLNTLRFMRNPLIDHMGIGEARMVSSMVVSQTLHTDYDTIRNNT
jgi:Leucine-rich repeat (LRR) protein